MNVSALHYYPLAAAGFGSSDKLVIYIGYFAAIAAHAIMLI